MTSTTTPTTTPTSSTTEDKGNGDGNGKDAQQLLDKVGQVEMRCWVRLRFASQFATSITNSGTGAADYEGAAGQEVDGWCSVVMPLGWRCDTLHEAMLGSSGVERWI